MTHLNYLPSAIHPSECISLAWELVKKRPFLYIGAILVMMILTSVIPYAGLLLVGPMMGGFSYIVLRDMRSEPIDFAMLFRGFRKFIPLMAIGIVQDIPGLGLQGAQLIAEATGNTGTYFPVGGDIFQRDPMTGTMTTGLTVGIVTFAIGFWLFSMIWNSALTFAIPLIIEHDDLGIVDAIALSFGALFRNIGGLFVLGLWSALVALLGMAAFCVGLLVAIPVISAAQVFAYREVFPVIPDGPEPSVVTAPENYTSIFGEGD